MCAVSEHILIKKFLSQTKSNNSKPCFSTIHSVAISSVCTSSIYLDANTKDNARYKIFKKFKKYFKKDISMVVTQNDYLLLAYSVTNIWISHPVHESWHEEFLSQPSVSPDFGTSSCRRVPPAPTTSYCPQNWGLRWRRASHSLRWNLGRALATIFVFCSLCDQEQNPTQSTTHLRRRIQLSFNMVW